MTPKKRSRFGDGVPSSRHRVSAAAIVFIALAGCSHWSGEPPIALSSAAIEPHPPLQDAAQRQSELGLVDRPELSWGLALSGGGVRSAMFNIGVLKALYDAGKLSEIDIISTVSGGGYAGYWLYANEQANLLSKAQFGKASFDPAVFQRRVCELSRTGNFQTYGRIFTSLATRNPARTSIAGYEEALKRTFGRDDRGLVQIDRLRVQTGRNVPYLVMNATVHDTPAKTGYWTRRLFEFTPLFRGNDELGYLAWSGGSLPIYHIAAISGAANAILAQPVKLPVENGERLLPLLDGGKSENLGAAALIRRGVRNIIVIDAEHDPHYQFGAYKLLRDELHATRRQRLLISALEGPLPKIAKQDLPTSIYTGTVVDEADEKLVSNIHYIKMAISHRTRTNLVQQRNQGTDGDLEQDRLDQDQQKGCDVPVEPVNLDTWAAYNAGSYERWLNGRSLKAKVVNSVNLEAAMIAFPQYSTLDQSYYADQLRAFVALGYLNGKEYLNGVPAVTRP